MAHEWRLLSHHGSVLLCIAQGANPTMREIADCVGITERATQRIVRELCERGFVSRVRYGRRNVYVLHPDEPIDEPSLCDQRVRALLNVGSPSPSG